MQGARNQQSPERRKSMVPQGEQKTEKIKKTHRFYLGSRERYIVFNCDFDSGNIQVIKQLSQFQYRLGSIPDNFNTKYCSNTKSWFYFSVCGFPKDTRGRFYIEKVQTLISIYQSKYSNAYRPVYKIGDGDWMRLPTQATLTVRENDIVEVFFDFTFKKETDIVYFAFCYPFSYQDNIKYIQSLGQNLYIDQYYYHQELLCFSPEGRYVHLLTVTSYDQKHPDNQLEEHFDDKLFPQRNRPLRFNKPVILITARVHPGETPASYAMKGVINFLTDKSDLRAFLLRKMFVFMVVPMINVDGVYNGHFRMDTYGQNLNRYYISPDFDKQPAVYGIKKLAEYLNRDRRLTFYFDLHAHNAKKGCFIYGNAINDFVDQVESQVFCKLFSMNTKSFQYEYCNFSLKHMKAKDRFENLTKEGCGRVVMHKLTGIIHSYSLECGLVSSNQLNVLSDPVNLDFKVENMGYVYDEIEDNNNKIYKGDQPPLYTPIMYQNVGKALLISILDTFDKNPYNRVYSSESKSMSMLRRMMAFQVFHEAERFRMFQRFTFYKVKNINELMQDNFKVKFNYKKIFNLNDNPILKNVEWPSNIIGLKKQQNVKAPNSPDKRRYYYKKQQNLYTGNSAEEQEDNEIYSQFLMKIKQSQNLVQGPVHKMSERTNREQSPDKQTEIDYRKRSQSPIKSKLMSSQLLDDEIKKQQALSMRVRKIFKNELRKQLKQSIKNQIKQEMTNMHIQIKSKLKHQIKSELKHQIFAEIQDITPRTTERKIFSHNPKQSQKNLPNLTIHNSTSVKQSIIINNNIGPIEDHQKRKSLQHSTRKDFRIESHRKKSSQKKIQFEQEKQINKIAVFEQHMKEMEDKLYDNNDNRPKLVSYELISVENQTETGVEFRSEIISNKKKKIQINSAKLRDYKRMTSKYYQSYSRFPQLTTPQKMLEKCHPYSGTFMVAIDPPKSDLNEVMKNTLKFEAMRMKDIMRNISKSRN